MRPAPPLEPDCRLSNLIYLGGRQQHYPECGHPIRTDRPMAILARLFWHCVDALAGANTNRWARRRRRFDGHIRAH